jgi:hypothetical protein
MKRVCILLATGLLLLGGSAARAAADDGSAPAPLNLTAPPAAPAEPVGCAAPGCAGPCGAASACEGHCGGHSGRFREWLMYRPPETRCHCRCPIAPCMPPLHTFFLDMCAHGGCCAGTPGIPGCNGGCGHGSCGSCAKNAPTAEPGSEGAAVAVPEPAPARPAGQ